jgi:hypothetical protein
MPTIDELVASVMHIPLHRRARSLRELIQHHVRHSLTNNHTVTPAAAHQALHLWSAMTVPPSTPVVAPRCRRSARISAGGSRAFNRQGGSADERTSAPPATSAAISVDAGPSEPPSNVVVPAAPLQPLTWTPPARIQVANVAYCDAHGWTVMVQVLVVLCSLPLDE